MKPVRYISTRGGTFTKSFCDILLEGLAPGGGLYLPEQYPQVTSDELAKWRGLSFPMLALRVLQKFVDIQLNDFWGLLRRSYTAQAFRYCRPGCNASDIAPLVTLEPGLHLLELSNGPTLAFKDMAMQLLGNLFEYVLARRGETINILGATSGDTGSAAEYAMRGKRGVRVFMMSPYGKMSAFQRAQMYSLMDKNIFNIAVHGNFDGCQDIVKAISNDRNFKDRYKIGAVNSINWARVAAQIVYYFWAYFRATKSNDEQVSFAVPSGNFGNICAGHIARMMGLPIVELVLATNENNVLDEFFRTGVYRPRNVVETHVTSSPSMDISKASNFERFIFDLVGRDPAVVQELWARVDRGQPFDLKGTPYWDKISSFGFVSGSSTHADRIFGIRAIWAGYNIMIDTHTADAFNVGLKHRRPGVPMIVFETAQAVKFDDTIREALRREAVRPAELDGIENLPQRSIEIQPSVDEVKNIIVQHCG